MSGSLPPLDPEAPVAVASEPPAVAATVELPTEPAWHKADLLPPAPASAELASAPAAPSPVVDMVSVSTPITSAEPTSQQQQQLAQEPSPAPVFFEHATSELAELQPAVDATAVDFAPAAPSSFAAEPASDAAVITQTIESVAQQPTSDLRSDVEATDPPAEIIAAAATVAPAEDAVAPPIESTSSYETNHVNGLAQVNGLGALEEQQLQGSVVTPEVAPVAPTEAAAPAPSTAVPESMTDVEASAPADEAPIPMDATNHEPSPAVEAPIVPPAPISAPETLPPPPVVPLPLVTELAQMPPLRHVDSGSSVIAQPSTPSSTTSAAPDLSTTAADSQMTSFPEATQMQTQDSAPTSTYDSFVNEQFEFEPPAPAPAPAPEAAHAPPAFAESAPATTVAAPDSTATVPPAEPSAAPAPAPTPLNVTLPVDSGFAPPAPKLAFAPAPSPSPAPTATPAPAPAPAVTVATPALEDVQMAEPTIGSPVLKRSAPEDSPAVVSAMSGATSDERDVKRLKVEEPSQSPAPTPTPAPVSLAAPASEAPRVLSPTPQPVLGYDPTAFTHVASLPHSVVSQPRSSPMPSSEMQQSQFASSSAPTSYAASPVQQTIVGTQTAVSSPGAYAHSPAPEVPATATATGPLPIMTKEQQKWGLGLIRTLKKNKNVGPFLRPVDPVALLIPDYFRVVTRPMDLGTVESKLNATGKAMAAAAKAGRTFGLDYTRGTGAWEGASDKVYRTAEEFKEDVARVWENCYRYNGPAEKNPVSAMAAALQEICERQWKLMPSAPLIEYVEPPRPPPQQVVMHAPAPVAAPASELKKDRRPSQSFVPTIRRSEDGTRPKREIHAPTRELPYSVADPSEQQVGAPSANKSRHGRVSGKTAQEQLRFCKEVIKELFKKVHEPYAYVFYEPVNYVALNIPQYPQIVKKPMDLGTIRTKLETGQYAASPYTMFETDVRLIFKNCYLFNPVGTPVNEWGHRLEHVFEQKWAERPQVPVEEEEEVSDDDGITAMEKQLQMMQANLELMKQQKRAEKEQARMMAAMHEMQAGLGRPSPKPAKKQSQERRQSSSSGAPKKARNSGGAAGGGGAAPAPKKKRAKREDDDMYAEPTPVAAAQPESVTFEMKRELAVKIVSFEGENLEKAIDIIRRGRPDLLSDANKEIELDIDQLDQRTLLALYRFVCPPPPKPKGARKANGVAAGPSKRKNLDEVKESERIEALEARLRDFENGGASKATAAATPAQPQHDVASSDSSSDEDSGSESEDDD